ncbi:MAG: hypothetical protein AAGI46_11725 [Planctomycetota bacterium]
MPLPTPIAGAITRGFVAANVIEAVLWVVVAGIVLAKWHHVPAATVLVFFGLSDLVETRTGAWWRPWWLFAWKAACVIALVALVLQAWRMKKAGAPEEERAPAAEEDRKAGTG